jgi:hypothetical protein
LEEGQVAEELNRLERGSNMRKKLMNRISGDYDERSIPRSWRV